MSASIADIGSSPRLRGTPWRLCWHSPPTRFIPAPAGNAAPPMPAHRIEPVHPRACGERHLLLGVAQDLVGSSPRLRGTRLAAAAQPARRRFIPAPAGNAGRIRSGTASWSVHPRACGERQAGAIIAPVGDGSSPRLRGTRLPRDVAPARLRFIPAPAGNARLTCSCSRWAPVHPRACGERRAGSRSSGSGAGSSPRLRGTPARRGRGRDRPRFIPAPAGNALPAEH